MKNKILILFLFIAVFFATISLSPNQTNEPEKYSSISFVGKTQDNKIFYKIAKQKNGNYIFLVNDKELSSPLESNYTYAISDNGLYYVFYGIQDSEYVVTTNNALSRYKKSPLSYISHLTAENDGSISYIYSQNGKGADVVLNGKTIYTIDAKNNEFLHPTNFYSFYKGVAYYSIKNPENEKSALFVNDQNLSGWVYMHTRPIIDNKTGDCYYLVIDNRFGKNVAVMKNSNVLYVATNTGSKSYYWITDDELYLDQDLGVLMLGEHNRGVAGLSTYIIDTTTGGVIEQKF